MVRVTDKTKAPAAALGTLGDPKALGIELSEQTLPEQVRQRYDLEKISIRQAPSSRRETAYVFADGNEVITENEFTRRYKDLTGSTELDDVHGRRTTQGLLVWGGATLASGVVFGWGITNLERQCTASDTEYYGSGSDLQLNEDYGDTGGLSSGVVASPDCVGRVGAAGHVLTEDAADYPGLRGMYNYDWIDPSKETPNNAGIAMTAVGAAGLAVSVPFFIWKLVDYDGSESDHRLAKADAELYVAQYNRKLLRRTVRETQTRMQRLSLRDAPNRSSYAIIMPILSPQFVGVSGRF